MKPAKETRSRSTLRGACRRFHLVASVALAVGLVPAFRAAGLPLHFDWKLYTHTYWVSLSLQTIFATTLLYIIQFPVAETFGPMLSRFRRQKWLLPLFIAPLAVLIAGNGPWFGVVSYVIGIAVIEWFHRSSEIRSSIYAAFLPSVYFFFGLILILSYNDVIAALRFDGRWDEVLNRIDARILFGSTVTGIAHIALSYLPRRAVDAMESLYVMTFPQIGACMLFLALRGGRKRSMQFVGTVLTAYYIALIFFWFFPNTGPYYLCRSHFSLFPDSPWFYNGQRPLLDALRAHQPPDRIRLDYLIGFPCMHIAQPMIVLWFLRKWTRIAAVLVAFDVLLIPSLLLLEQHYVVDLIGGVAVAALAIAMVDWPIREKTTAKELDLAGITSSEPAG